MAARERLLEERARGVAQLVELAAGALRVVAGPKRSPYFREGPSCQALRIVSKPQQPDEPL